eukprot:TRINITY_DN48404_c0_g1_i1.p1 TRINITY_DN48404_c0_g1~~TRINITY_DN48404_c0_g1_i1.p1  ORF type:complete len:602 (+),score=119.80 TRINITY_DN48404_c0_g1_i1:37-1842(+)
MPGFDFDCEDTVEITHELIRAVPLFGLPEEEGVEDKKFVDEVFKRLKKQAIAPMTYVVKKDEIGNSMFFVLEGEMEMVYPDRVKQISEDDEYSFGEISLVYSTKRSASIRAKTECHCFVLTKDSFEEILPQFPAIAKVIEKIAKEKYSPNKRVQQTRSVAAEEEENRKKQREDSRAQRKKQQIDEVLLEVENELKALEDELAGKDISDGKEKYTFSNGDVYEGEWLSGAMHGTGIYTYNKTGNRYEGDWKNNQKEGNGTYHYKASGNKYSGEWKAGVKNGKGTFIDNENNKYEGEWKTGQMSGHGSYTYANQDKYVGYFEKNEFNGMGCFTYANGDKYEGEWLDGQQHGKGKLTTYEGHVYDGEWKEDQKHGTGKYSCRDFTYVGDWESGFMHGKGLYTYANGDKYDGHWVKDKEEGQGVYTANDGTKYDGTWKAGAKEGYGIETATDGERYEGEWKDDLKHGTGSYFYSSNASYCGEWDAGVMHGKGIYTYRSGKKCDVTYQDGTCVEKKVIEEGRPGTADRPGSAARPGTAGSRPTSAKKMPEWVDKLNIDDDLKQIFVTERITEDVFEELSESDMKSLGFPFGACKTLMKEINRRKAA